MSSRDVRLPPPCSHLEDYRSSRAGAAGGGGAARPFRALHRCLRGRPLGRAEVRREPDEVPRCGSCQAGAGSLGPRLYARLACAAVSCRAHAPGHADSRRPGHEIAADVDRAELFCCACRDQVYDRDFDAAVVLAQKALSFTTSSPSGAPPPPEKKRWRVVDYRPWAPDTMERAVVGRGSSPLLNAPPLRNYFLSDRHNRYVCQQKRQRRRNAAVGAANGASHGNRAMPRKGLCLACDLPCTRPSSPAIRYLTAW